ncbi:McrC family protein [Microbacterium sp. SS28]|uniref:McrC family protein n=1 Tax=Microbacterium sp. SS28 TaxID=2919948 RepID=UPI001FA9AFE2|nr:McrC family protein [Microbacterium sp. SS28]
MLKAVQMRIPPTNAQMISDRIAIKASPRGTRAGFCAISDGAGGALTFTVLPKPWADARGAVSAIHHHRGMSTHVTLFELDTVEIVTEPGVRDLIAQGLLETGGEAEAGAEAEGGTHDGYLLERVRLVGVDEVAEPRPAGRSLEDVVRVMLLVKRQRSVLGGAGYQGSPEASLLRIVSQQMLLDEVGRVIDRVRPRYRTRTESLATPRGKLSAQSLALALTTGRPTVESTFDELSTDTDVLRIVLAALRVVATDPAPSRLSTIVGSLQSRAIGFARRLDSVTILDRERALLAHRRLAMSPLDQPWRVALDLAAEVLSRHAIVPEGHEAWTSRTITISLYMEKWWEQVLADALRICADSGSVAEQLPVSSPWTGGGEGSADLFFALDGHAILADGKYKLDESTIGAADAYQLFAYSYTADAPQIGRPESAAVFYPARKAAAGGTRSILERATSPDFRLHLVDLPFPSRDDVMTDLAWRSYLERLASRIAVAFRRDGALEIAPPA